MKAHRCTRRQAFQGAGATLVALALLGPRVAIADEESADLSFREGERGGAGYFLATG